MLLKVGTRDSRLARVQTGNALERMRESLPGLEFELVPMSSPGDRDRETDLRESPDDFFTRDLDEALLDKRIDVAIHSAKDVPPSRREDLDWCWLPWREDRRDALILAPGRAVADLPDDLRIGVSSERREAWCRARFPAARLAPVRGNIEDRLKQLDQGDFDALLMAGAALLRLGLADRITQWIPLAELETPEGQGTLAMVFRAMDPRLQRLRSLFVKGVTFAGAGVGSAELATVGACEALEHCDVCLHDSLMPPELLSRLRPGAAAVDVGKRCGAHSLEQPEINRLLLDHARRGARVVRLKGGDPGIFGRLSEEIEALAARLVPYRIIPGVSSLNAATTGTGLVVTRRGAHRGFCVITPRKRGGGTAPVNAAARAELPIVLFMTVRVLEEVAQELMDDGMPGDTTVSIISEAGGIFEEVRSSTLETIPGDTALMDPGRPAIAIVGRTLNPLPGRHAGALGGRRVLLTCSEALQPRAALAVRDAGGVPVRLPLIRLVPAEGGSEALREVGNFDAVVVTSPSAVRFLVRGLREHGIDIRCLPRVVVSGSGTAAELRRHLVEPDIVPGSGFGGDALVKAVCGAGLGDGRVLRVRSDVAGPDLAEALRSGGMTVEDCVLYRNETIRYDAMPPWDTVFFASSSAVAAFVSGWGRGELENRTVLAIGEPTSRALVECGRAPDLVSPEATVETAMRCLACRCVAEELGTGS